jgi:hypothetical protein
MLHVGEMAVQFHIFLTSALDEGGPSASHIGPKEKTLVETG